MPDQIYYLSCLPGVGKTRLAVQKMAKHLQSSKGIFIYVAPTGKLLDEVRSYLEKREEVKEEHHNKIRKIVSEGGQGTIASYVVALLAGTRGYRALEGGTVILMAHKGFLTLPANLPRKDEIEVVFDEAHKFAAELKPVAIKSKVERRLFKKLIAENSTTLLDPEGKDTGFKKFSLRSWPTALKHITNTATSKKQYASLHEVISSAVNYRTDVYVKEHSRKKQHSFYEITMPSRVFTGYKTVILLAAFLEDTQMWHLLKQSTELKPLWEHPDYVRIKKRVELHSNQILDRFGKLCIFPLTPQTRPNSLSRMASAIMVPADRLDAVREGLRNLKVSSLKRVRLVANRTNWEEATDEEHMAVEFLKAEGAKFKPFLWYMRAATNFVKELRSEGRVTGDVLAVVNEVHSQDLMDYFPELTKIPTVSHGLNKYLDSNTLIFTAAILPDLETALLYKVLLPEYDYMKDHLADSCAQAVTRLSVRDVKSDVISYVILPDRATADILKSKLLNRPVIVDRAIKKPGMVALGSLAPERKPRVLKEGTKMSRWRNSDLNRQLASKRASRSRLRKRLQADPTNQGLIDKIEALDQQLSALLANKGK